jgi:hypothetical protein
MTTRRDALKLAAAGPLALAAASSAAAGAAAAPPAPSRHPVAGSTNSYRHKQEQK